MANNFKLQEGHPVDENLRPIKVGGESTALELSKDDVRVNNLHVNGTLSGVSSSDPTKLPLAGGTMTGDITTDSNIVSTNLTIDDSGSISLDSVSTDGGSGLLFKDGGTKVGDITCHHSATNLTLYENEGASTSDYCGVLVYANGSTIILTQDQAGDAAHLKLSADGDMILNSKTGNYIAKKDDTEFSAANSAYAGMILGYTKIMNDGTGASDAYITTDATLTVLQTASGTNLSIAFVVPPSGNVEITMDLQVYASSRTLEFALSDNASYNEIDETHTYDAGVQSSDETDVNMVTARWVVTGLTANASLTYYIAAAETLSGTGIIRHGRYRDSGTHYPPIIIKAVALPATITTGG